jgi:hypothetical protein
MGGELDKKTLQNPEEEMLKNGKTQGKNHKNKHLQNDTEIRQEQVKQISKEFIREMMQRKKRKIKYQ